VSALEEVVRASMDWRYEQVLGASSRRLAVLERVWVAACDALDREWREARLALEENQ